MDPRPGLPQDVIDAIARGHRIDAIRRLREATGLGLREAKALVEAHEAGATDAGEPRSPAAARMPTVVSGRSGVGIGSILALLVAAALAAWWWFGR